MESKDNVSWVSYPGVGLSRTASQCVSAGTWFVLDDGTSGCAGGLFVAICFEGVEGDSTVDLAALDIREFAGVRSLLIDTDPSVDWLSKEQAESRPRRLQAPQG